MSQYLRVGCAVGPFLYLGNLEVDSRTQEKKTFMKNQQEFKSLNNILQKDIQGTNMAAPQEGGVEMNTLAGYCMGEVAEMKTNISSRESKNVTNQFIL